MIKKYFQTYLMVFFFLPKKCALYFKKMQFRVCFLKIFRPLKVALHNYNDRYLRYNRPQLGIFMDMNCNQTDHFIDEVILNRKI